MLSRTTYTISGILHFIRLKKVEEGQSSISKFIEIKTKCLDLENSVFNAFSPFLFSCFINFVVVVFFHFFSFVCFFFLIPLTSTCFIFCLAYFYFHFFLHFKLIFICFVFIFVFIFAVILF